MRASLSSEVRSFLLARGASTAAEVALGVRARRDDVAGVLAGEGFQLAEKPEGGSPRAVYFVVSCVVPLAEVGIVQTDKQFVLAVLGDGRWHSLSEIVSRSFAERQCGLTVHSRVSDLRRHDGYVVEQRDVWIGSRRGSEYRLVGRAVAAGSVPASSPDVPGRPDANLAGDGYGSSSERQRSLFGEAA